MDDAALKPLLEADAPPPCDPRFVLAVMTRIEQRRFRRELAMTAALTACSVVLLWLLAPAVETVWHDGIAPYASNVVILLVLMSATLAVPYLLPAQND